MLALFSKLHKLSLLLNWPSLACKVEYWLSNQIEKLQVPRVKVTSKKQTSCTSQAFRKAALRYHSSHSFHFHWTHLHGRMKSFAQHFGRFGFYRTSTNSKVTLSLEIMRFEHITYEIMRLVWIMRFAMCNKTFEYSIHRHDLIAPSGIPQNSFQAPAQPRAQLIPTKNPSGHPFLSLCSKTNVESGLHNNPDTSNPDIPV